MASKFSPKHNENTRKHKGKNIEEQVYVYAHEKLLNWILDNLKIIGIVAGVILLIVIIGVSWRTYQKGMTAKALTLESKAFTLHQEAQAELASAGQQTDAETAPDPEKAYQEVTDLYQEILDQYPGTQSAARATYLLGSIAYQQGKYAEAQEYFSTYLQKYSEGALAVEAEESLGYIQEQQQNYQQAIDIFKALEAKVSESKKPAILLAIGRNYEALEQPDDAMTIYQQVVDSNTSFSLKNTAKERLDMLQAAQSAPAAITAPQEESAAAAPEETPIPEQSPAAEPAAEAPTQEAQPAEPEQATVEPPASEESTAQPEQQAETAEQPAEQDTQAEESTQETNQ
jgi:TolA-binding protein